MKRNALFASFTLSALIAGYVAIVGDIGTGRVGPLEDVAAEEERLLEDSGWRVRALAEGPRAALYLASDDGVIRQIVPAEL